MPEYTPNLDLYKPNRQDDNIDVDTSLSENFVKIDDKAAETDKRIDTVANLSTTAPVYIYVNGLTGDDTANTGAVDSPFKTIQRAANSIPKFIVNDHFIRVAKGTYDEEVDVRSIVGAGLFLECDEGTLDPTEPTGFNVRSVTFHSVWSYIWVNGIDFYWSDTITKPSVVSFNRCAYGTVNSCRFDSGTKVTSIPSIVWNSSNGSANSNYFYNQYECLQIVNGSNVRVDNSNQLGGNPATRGMYVRAAAAYLNGGSSWLNNSDTPIIKSQGGQVFS